MNSLSQSNMYRTQLLLQQRYLQALQQYLENLQMQLHSPKIEEILLSYLDTYPTILRCFRYCHLFLEHGQKFFFVFRYKEVAV